jgi:hypothetical protein
MRPVCRPEPFLSRAVGGGAVIAVVETREMKLNIMIAKQLLGVAVLSAALHTVTAAEIWEGDNRFSLNAALACNIKLSSRNLQPAPPNPGPATGAQVDRFYDNGYVRVDVSDNAGNQTTWWQFDTALGATSDHLPGGAVTLTSTRSPAQGETLTAEDDPHVGLEFGYARRLFRCGNERKPWLIVGVEGGLAFFDLGIRDTSGVTGNAVTADTYHLAPGNVVLSSSYEGNYLGDPAGPLLGSEPTARDFTAGSASLAHAMSGQMYGFKLGPTLELPLGQSLLLGVSGGLALMGVDAEDSFQETVTIGENSVVSNGNSHFDSWHAGPYVKVSLAINLGRQWQAQCGVQWQDNGDMTEQTGNYETRLDLNSVVLFTFGVGYSF